MSLLGTKKHQRPIIVAIGLFGAALIYGDGAITPAISVLSALEGLNIATPAVPPYVLPGAVPILIALFAIQPQETLGLARPSARLCPYGFFAIAVMGIGGIARHPAVLAALNPLWVALPVLQRLSELPHSGWRFSLCDRSRSALRRHGPFRPSPDSIDLVVYCSSESGAELCRPIRSCARRYADCGQHFLPALSRAFADPFHHPSYNRDHCR